MGGRKLIIWVITTASPGLQWWETRIKSWSQELNWETLKWDAGVSAARLNTPIIFNIW